MWIKKIQNKEHKKCKHMVGNYCCLFSTVPPEPMFECWNHKQLMGQRAGLFKFPFFFFFFFFFLVVVMAVVFLSFSFIIFCLFFFLFSLPRPC